VVGWWREGASKAGNKWLKLVEDEKFSGGNSHNIIYIIRKQKKRHYTNIRLFFGHPCFLYTNFKRR
jgi:hypothetical protein